jgi:hypothetical protein
VFFPKEKNHRRYIFEKVFPKTIDIFRSVFQITHECYIFEKVVFQKHMDFTSFKILIVLKEYGIFISPFKKSPPNIFQKMVLQKKKKSLAANWCNHSYKLARWYQLKVANCFDRHMSYFSQFNKEVTENNTLISLSLSLPLSFIVIDNLLYYIIIL